MPRKKLGNVQFKCRVKPALLKEIRKHAKAKKVRLGEVVEWAFEKFIDQNSGK